MEAIVLQRITVETLMKALAQMPPKASVVFEVGEDFDHIEVDHRVVHGVDIVNIYSIQDDSDDDNDEVPASVVARGGRYAHIDTLDIMIFCRDHNVDYEEADNPYITRMRMVVAIRAIGLDEVFTSHFAI